LEAVIATGTPTVVMLVAGRAYVLPEAVDRAAALLISSYGGPFGPRAIADVLVGAVNPGGRLPYSIPRHTGQIPVYHHRKTGTGHRTVLPPGAEHHYLDMAATPRYPFGAGTSYTDFALTDLRCDDRIRTDGRAGISAVVGNIGARGGATVVQLYAGVRSVGVSRPYQQLVGFARVELAPGEARRVSFEVAAAQLGCTNAARDFAVEPGRVELFIGFHADDRRLTGQLAVEGPARVLRAADRTFLSAVMVEPIRHEEESRCTSPTPG
jgi:beta-glucosidase